MIEKLTPEEKKKEKQLRRESKVSYILSEMWREKRIEEAKEDLKRGQFNRQNKNRAKRFRKKVA